jgi:hypothetical protein
MLKGFESEVTAQGAGPTEFTLNAVPLLKFLNVVKGPLTIHIHPKAPVGSGLIVFTSANGTKYATSGMISSRSDEGQENKTLEPQIL